MLTKFIPYTLTQSILCSFYPIKRLFNTRLLTKSLWTLMMDGVTIRNVGLINNITQFTSGNLQQKLLNHVKLCALKEIP